MAKVFSSMAWRRLSRWCAWAMSCAKLVSSGLAGLNEAIKGSQKASQAARSSSVMSMAAPVRPWRWPLMRAFFLPSSVLGPVDFMAFRRLAKSCFRDTVFDMVNGLLACSLAWVGAGFGPDFRYVVEGNGRDF